MVKIFESSHTDNFDTYAEEIHSILKISAKDIYKKDITDDLKDVYGFTDGELKDFCDHYYNKYKLEEFVISNGVLIEYNGKEKECLTIPDNVYKIDSGVFSNTEIDRVYLNSVSIIADSAFENCRLFRIDFGNSLKYIGNSSFFNTNLVTANIPETVKHIGKNAFANNKYLANVRLRPLDYLGDYAFAHCDDLTDVSIESISNAISNIKTVGKKIISTPLQNANYTLDKLLNNATIKRDIINFISSAYGCDVNTRRAFILPNGECVSTLEDQPHYTLDNEICDYLKQKHNIVLDIKNDGIFGSLIMDNLNCIRVNCVFENYIFLPRSVNNTQYDTLCDWLDFFFETTHYRKPIQITDDTGWQESFNPQEMTADDIIKYLKRNYNHKRSIF